MISDQVSVSNRQRQESNSISRAVSPRSTAKESSLAKPLILETTQDSKLQRRNNIDLADENSLERPSGLHQQQIRSVHPEHSLFEKKDSTKYSLKHSLSRSKNTSRHILESSIISSNTHQNKLFNSTNQAFKLQRSQNIPNAFSRSFVKKNSIKLNSRKCTLPEDLSSMERSQYQSDSSNKQTKLHQLNLAYLSKLGSKNNLFKLSSAAGFSENPSVKQTQASKLVSASPGETSLNWKSSFQGPKDLGGVSSLPEPHPSLPQQSSAQIGSNKLFMKTAQKFASKGRSSSLRSSEGNRTRGGNEVKTRPTSRQNKDYKESSQLSEKIAKMQSQKPAYYLKTQNKASKHLFSNKPSNKLVNSSLKKSDRSHKSIVTGKSQEYYPKYSERDKITSESSMMKATRGSVGGFGLNYHLGSTSTTKTDSKSKNQGLNPVSAGLSTLQAMQNSVLTSESQTQGQPISSESVRKEYLSKLQMNSVIRKLKEEGLGKGYEKTDKDVDTKKEGEKRDYREREPSYLFPESHNQQMFKKARHRTIKNHVFRSVFPQ